MDSSTVVSLVIAVVVGLMVGAIPLEAVIRSQLALKSAIERTPSLSPPDPDDLEPEELAYLAGGPVRVAETIIMDLHLSGRIRHQQPRGFFTLVGPSTPYTHEKSLIRRVIIMSYRDRVGLTAREMVRRAVTSGGMIALADGLKASRLRVDSPGLRRVLASREKVPSRIVQMQILCFTVCVVAGGFFLGGPGNTIHLGLVIGALSAAAMLAVVKVVLNSTGGATLLATTPAGRAVVAEARDRYEVVAQSTTDLDRDVAVRYTAVTGFRALSDAVLADDRGPASRHASSAPASGGAEAGAVIPPIEDGVRLESLCGFAEVCQGDTGGSGSGSGSDGWGGGFSGGDGGSGSSGGWGDGGSGGGGDGGSGGGGGDGGGGGGE